MAARGSSAWRKKHWPVCDDAGRVKLVVKPGITLWVAPAAQEAFTVLFDTFAYHNYVPRPGVTGAYNCRKITGGRSYSSHAYGTAGDVNWDTNPYVKGRLVTDMPPEMVEACLEIETTDGLRVFRWGGDWDNRPDTPHNFYDAMHWEIICTPEELAAGIERTIDAPKERVSVWPHLHRGARGGAVANLQIHLREIYGDVGVDGIFGGETDRYLRRFQETRALPVTGATDPGTWTALVHRLPVVPPGAIGPDKQVRPAA